MNDHQGSDWSRVHIAIEIDDRGAASFRKFGFGATSKTQMVYFSLTNLHNVL